MPTRRSLAALALLASACGPSSQTTQLRNAVTDAGAREVAHAVAFRFGSRRGADVRLYELPGLDEVSWRFTASGLVTSRVVGFAPGDDVVFALTPDATVAALDLESGRARVVDSGIARAALGPDGRLLLARRDGNLAALVGRRPVTLAPLQNAEIEELHGGTGGRAIAVVRTAEGREVLVVSGGAVIARRALPPGPFATAPWGDAVAVATEGQLTLTPLLREEPDRQALLESAPRAVAFSASGHRIFVATDEPALEVFDRFALDRLERVALPAPVEALRTDRFGYWVMGRTTDGLIVTRQSGGPVATTAAAWSDDLPAAAPDGTLLVRRENDVVALAAPGHEPRGRVAEGGRDRWLVAVWDARRPELQLAAQPAGQPAARAVPGQEIYVQVSSTSNSQWAEGLARDLQLAGMRASVLPPAGDEEMFRVVIGPYATRDEAEAIGRKLGMPYWIFTREPTSGTP